MHDQELAKEIEDALKEVPTNLTWLDEDAGVWKGWTFNPEKNRYYFDDIGNESLMGLWEDQWLREADGSI